MEVNRRSEGLLKRKLTRYFYRAAKPDSLAMKYSTTKVKPSPSAAASSAGFIVKHDKVTTPQPKQKISFASPEISGRETYTKFESLYSGGVADESVDWKAANYISCVQERFRLE